jgi:hypothetical protein
MGVFKKLSGNDVRVTPIQVAYGNNYTDGQSTGNSISFNSGKVPRSEISGSGIDSEALLYASIRQLFYSSFVSQNYLASGSCFDTAVSGTVTQQNAGIFSRFDPSFQGSLAYQRNLPVANNKEIKVTSIPTKNFGESIVPGTVEYAYSTLRDDAAGNLIDKSTGVVQGNIFYDQGIIVTTGWSGNGNTPMVDSDIQYSGSYTIYNTQYKCTANPNEFNYSLNPTLLSSSNTEYDSSIIDSPDFMPYVTTIGLYNDNQELMMVAKLSQPMQLNPYTDTNFIVRLDR